MDDPSTSSSAMSSNITSYIWGLVVVSPTQECVLLPTLTTPLLVLPHVPTIPVSASPLALFSTTKEWNVSTLPPLEKLDPKHMGLGKPEFGADPDYNGEAVGVESGGASEQTLLLDEYYHRLLLVLLPLGVALDLLALLAFSHSRRKHSRCVAILESLIPFASTVY